jgi:hypothetical protein
MRILNIIKDALDIVIDEDDDDLSIFFDGEDSS